MRIERQQPIGFFWIAGRGGLPLDQTARAIQFSDGVNIGDEVILPGQWPLELDLQVALRLANTDAVVLAEPVQELDALLQHPVPAVAI